MYSKELFESNGLVIFLLGAVGRGPPPFVGVFPGFPAFTDLYPRGGGELWILFIYLFL